MSSPAPSNEASPCPAFAGSSPVTSLLPSSSDSPSAKKIVHKVSPLTRGRPAQILDLPEEIHRLIVLALVELPARPLLSQTQDDVYAANQQLVNLALVSKTYKAISYPILYEEIMVKSDKALARFLKTIKTYPALKDRVRMFWPLYWNSNTVVSPYFVGEFPRLEVLSLMNDLKLLSTPYELDFNKFTGDDDEDALVGAIDDSDDDEIDSDVPGSGFDALLTPSGAGPSMLSVKAKGKKRMREPDLDIMSTPELALKREKARNIARQLRQIDKRRAERETKPTVVQLKTLEITMNGLKEMPRMNMDLDQLETLSIVWVPKPAHEFKTPLPMLKTLYLSTYGITSDREYEPQMLRVLKEYGPQLEHLHFEFRGIDDHIPSDVTPFCPSLSTLTIISPFFHSYCVYHGHPTVSSLRFGLPVAITEAQLEVEGLFNSTITKMDVSKWPKLKEIWLLELDWDERDHRGQTRVEEWEGVARKNGWVLKDGKGRTRVGDSPSELRRKALFELQMRRMGRKVPTEETLPWMMVGGGKDVIDLTDDSEDEGANGSGARTPA